MEDHLAKDVLLLDVVVVRAPVEAQDLLAGTLKCLELVKNYFLSELMVKSEETTLRTDILLPSHLVLSEMVQGGVG